MVATAEDSDGGGMHAVSTMNLEVEEQFPLQVSDAGSTSDLKSNEPTW